MDEETILNLPDDITRHNTNNNPWILSFFLSSFLLFGCGIRQVDTLPLPGGETAIYVKAQTRMFGMAVLDRWVFDPKTGETRLVRSDSSESTKGIMDALKGIPIPVPIP